MILSDLKRYLEERRQATLTDMAVHFGAEPEAVRGMLSIWIAKGRVEPVPMPPGCGTSCILCDATSAEIYRWVPPGGREQPPATDDPDKEHRSTNEHK